MDIDISKVSRGLTEADKRVTAGTLLMARTGAKKIESYAKTTARWKNRTGNARRTLRGDADYTRGNSEVTIAVSHGMDYGEFLETRFDGKYAILEEAIEVNAPEIIRNIARLI